MVPITVSRKQMVGKAPRLPPAREMRRRGYSRDLCPCLAPYLFLTSVLYKIMADTITITVNRNTTGCMTTSCLSQTHTW